MDLFLPSRYSRRTFFKQAVAISATGLVGPGLLTACGNENAAERSESETTVSEKCQESADLPASNIAARQAINYVDESPHLDKECANCRFFKQSSAGATCGECEVVKGPIAPGGFCNAWVVQS